MSQIRLTPVDPATLTTPASGTYLIFLDSTNDDLLSRMDDTGAVTTVSDGSILVNTAAGWAADTTVYSSKTILVTSDAYYGATDQRKFKIADGTQTWSNLDYMPIGTGSNDLAATLVLGNTTGGTDIEVSAGDNIIIDDATASRILSSGASKEIVSLDTATYPSLTELSYVKGVTSAIQTQLGNKVPTSRILTINGTGYDLSSDRSWTVGDWIADSNTWTYASADDPTFTLTVNADLTSVISVGMRIRLVQTTTKYFIVTAISYSAPNTTITIYGGTDYDLANAAISSPYYSGQKVPFGFPASPDKWSVTFSDTSNRTQSNPAAGTIYNIGTSLITLPIGDWNVQATVGIETSGTSTNDITVGLSTANNTFSSAELKSYWYSVTPVDIMHKIQGQIVTASKTVYYLNARIGNAGATGLLYIGGAVTTKITARCNYL